MTIQRPVILLPLVSFSCCGRFCAPLCCIRPLPHADLLASTQHLVCTPSACLVRNIRNPLGIRNCPLATILQSPILFATLLIASRALLARDSWTAYLRTTIGWSSRLVWPLLSHPSSAPAESRNRIDQPPNPSLQRTPPWRSRLRWLWAHQESGRSTLSPASPLNSYAVRRRCGACTVLSLSSPEPREVPMHPRRHQRSCRVSEGSRSRWRLQRCSAFSGSGLKVHGKAGFRVCSAARATVTFARPPRASVSDFESQRGRCRAMPATICLSLPPSELQGCRRMPSRKQATEPADHRLASPAVVRRRDRALDRLGFGTVVFDVQSWSAAGNFGAGRALLRLSGSKERRLTPRCSGRRRGELGRRWGWADRDWVGHLLLRVRR